MNFFVRATIIMTFLAQTSNQTHNVFIKLACIIAEPNWMKKCEQKDLFKLTFVVNCIIVFMLNLKKS